MNTFSIQSLMNTSGPAAIEARAAQLENMLRAVETPSTGAVSGGFKRTLMDASAFRPSQVVDAVPAAVADRIRAFMPSVEKYARDNGVDTALVKALIRQESGFNPNAVSGSGALGLMQLMPATAKGLGVENPLDPEQNLAGGIRHLKGLLARYHGNVPLALAAYNAGGGAVDKHGGIPPYKETQNYVRNILAMYIREKQA